MTFAGKAILITGAASGLGRAAALRFAEEGAALCLVDVNKEGLQTVAAAVAERGGQSISLVTDIRTQPHCAAAVNAAMDAFGRLDVLCNVAGVVSFNPLARITPAEWEKVIGVNLSGPLYLCQAAMPHLIAAGGAIVNVASSAAFIGEAYLAPYAASKAALVSLTKSLAMEFMHEPVRINALAPGGMMTGMATSAQLPPDADPALIARFTGLRPPAEPEDVAEVLVFLASDKARNVHGACFSADGGVTAG